MSRRKTEQSQRYAGSTLGHNAQNQFNSEPYIPEYGLRSKQSIHSQPDSLQKFQWELQSYLKMQKNKFSISEKKRRVNTEAARVQNQILENNAREINQLKLEIRQLKGSLQTQHKLNPLQDRLDRLLIQLSRDREEERANRLKTSQQLKTVASQPYYPIYNMYPPYPPPYAPYSPHNDRYQRHERKRSLETESKYSSLSYKPPKNKYRASEQLRRKLRKYFFVVTFTVFVRKEAKKLSTVRKNNMRKFYLQKFDSQIQHAKNWLVDAHAYCISIILEKKKHSISFQNQKNQKIRAQKQNLILKLIMIGCQKMKSDCTTQKISLFSELIYNLCRRGSFCMSRFWTAYQMQNISISEYYGFLRVDDSLEKFLIGIVLFMKLLIFNMFLQPHKFDSINFPKDQQPLKNNMYIISSVYYRLVKEVLEEYLQQDRPPYYKIGNWLNVKSQYIVECCEPLVFNCEYPDSGQFISGMISQQSMEFMKNQADWGKIKSKIAAIIDFFHKEMVNKGALIRKNLKYKLYK